MTSYALETQDLSKKFGGFVATDHVNLQIASGARHALIGPNGAGKTTLINLLTGFLEPTSGQVLLHGENITHLPQYKRVLKGLARTFQINQLFPELTVLETITMAVNEHQGLGGRMWKAVGKYSTAIEQAIDLLAKLKLLDVAQEKTRNLPYGKQRLIEIALALAMQPKVLLLDEPAAGVPTNESRELFETIAALPRDVTILLIEHDMDLVFRFADTMTVLVNGAILTQGSPEAIAHDPLVKQVYLGEVA